MTCLARQYDKLSPRRLDVEPREVELPGSRNQAMRRLLAKAEEKRESPVPVGLEEANS